jgi:hypothetical protein
MSGNDRGGADDGFEVWPDHVTEINGSDVFTLRRVVPRDRGMNWQ